MGKNGQVGWELQRSLAPLGELTSLDRHSLGLCGDLSDLAGFAATVQDVRPDVIVNGQTKLEGEQLIATTCAQHLIFRTSWVYAARGGNFAKTMLRLARERNSLRVIDDQFGAPTGAELLADVTAHAIRQVLQRPGDAGLYHVAAAGEATWCSYANHALE